MKGGTDFVPFFVAFFAGLVYNKFKSQGGMLLVLDCAFRK